MRIVIDHESYGCRTGFASIEAANTRLSELFPNARIRLQECGGKICNQDGEEVGEVLLAPIQHDCYADDCQCNECRRYASDPD
jgi:hypothetical protein